MLLLGARVNYKAATIYVGDVIQRTLVTQPSGTILVFAATVPYPTALLSRRRCPISCEWQQILNAFMQHYSQTIEQRKLYVMPTRSQVP
jgi:hypothetical protein